MAPATSTPAWTPSFDVADVVESQFFHQAVLQGTVHALHAALGLA